MWHVDFWILFLLSPAYGITYNCINKNTPSLACCHGEITLDPTLTTIEENAFFGCSGLSGSLTIPSSVTMIGDGAFFNCSGLTGSLTISSSVTSIGKGAFDSCDGFTGSLTIPSSVKLIGDWAFFNCSGFTGSLTIPSSVTSLGDYAFVGCSGFTGSLTIPTSVTSISEGAFSGCSGFTDSLIIPPSVTSIGAGAFSGCSGFTGSLIIPSSVISIGNYSFLWCDGFTDALVIPSSVTSIGNDAFHGCSGFTRAVTFPNSVTFLGSSAFADNLCNWVSSCRCTGAEMCITDTSCDSICATTKTASSRLPLRSSMSSTSEEPTSTVVQFTGTTQLIGINSSQIDNPVIKAFQSMTAETLGVDTDAVNVTSVTDTHTRRGLLDTRKRFLGSAGVNIDFTVIIILEKTDHTNATLAIHAYSSILETKFTSTTAGLELVTSAILKGSAFVTSSTVLTLTVPTLNYNYISFVVQTGAPSTAPTPAIDSRGSGGDGNGMDTTSIIIGGTVGGVVLLIILLGTCYYCGGRKNQYTSKIEPS